MYKKGGFTILEVIIVLAVTSGLIIGALGLINGRQGRTQFAQGVRETESLIRDVMNDVNNGNSNADISGLSCLISATAPNAPYFTYDTTAAGLGKQSACIFAGKVIQFGSTANASDLNIFSVAGRRLDPSGNTITSFNNLMPVAIHPQNSSPVNTSLDATDRRKLPTGIQVVKDASGTATSWAIGVFYKDFRGGSLASGDISSGNSSVGLATVRLASTAGIANMAEAQVVSSITALGQTSPTFGSTYTLCLKSGTSNQYATITIGGGANNLDVSSQVDVNLSSVTCTW